MPAKAFQIMAENTCGNYILLLKWGVIGSIEDRRTGPLWRGALAGTGNVLRDVGPYRIELVLGASRPLPPTLARRPGIGSSDRRFSETGCNSHAGFGQSNALVGLMCEAHLLVN